MDDKRLTLGSLFSGSGGFELAGILSGIIPVWASEVEPFPIRVTTKRMPRVKHYGDVSALSGAVIEPVDIITFGSPCQDMSVAGRRAGLDGERSVLFHEAIRIIREMREKTNGEYPRYIVWENVPGAFSSNKGEDFKAVLEAVIGIKEPGIEVPAPDKGGWPYADIYLGDGWSVAYRVLDAQYWGVPQRRSRIFLVADFAGGGAGEILFKSEGLSGYSAEGIEAWKRAAGGIEGCAGASGGLCLNDQGGAFMNISEETAGTLRSETHGHEPIVLAAGFCTNHSAASRSIGYGDETSPTLRAGAVPAAVALEHHPADSRIGIDGSDTIQTLTSRMGTGGGNVPLIMTPDGPLPAVTMKIRCGGGQGGKGPLWQTEKSATLATNNDQTLFQPKDQTAFGISADSSYAMLSDNPHAGIYKAKTSRTLDQSGGNPGCHQGGIAVVEPAYALQGNMIGRKDENGPKGDGVNEDVCFTLSASDRHAIAARETYAATVGSFMQVEKERANTLMARDFKDPQIVNSELRSPEYIVRRLTPTECARLQGFPDWWCRGLGTDEPTEDDIAFWTDVFETHRKVITKAKKPKTRKQIIKWLKDPYLDSAEYRLWGNGICLNIAVFVLSGIAWYASGQ